MKCLVLFILAVVLITAEGKAIPDDAENQQPGKQSLQASIADRIRKAQNVISNLDSEIREYLSESAVINTFKEHSSSLVNSVNEYLKNVTEEMKAKGPDLENLWTNMKTKVSETLGGLNISPETREQIDQLYAKFEEGIQSIVTESENIAKTIREKNREIEIEMSQTK